MHGFVFGLSFLFHWFICLSFCLDYCSFAVIFEIGKCESSNFVVFQNCLAVLGPLSFLMSFRISFSIFTKTPAGILIECGESIDTAEEYYYFNNSKSFDPWTWNVFLLLRFLQLFLTVCCSFQSISFAFLLIIFPRILFYFFKVMRCHIKVSFLKNLFIYLFNLFLAVLGLSCSTWAL